jgi:hypothetical protein
MPSSRWKDPSTGLAGSNSVTGDRAGLFALGYAVVRIAIWPLWVKRLRHLGVGPVRATVFGPG